MLTYEQLKEKCSCWTGYKRKPGTAPCAEGSCVKEELEKHHALAFGRMNPITSGHEAVVNKLHSVAKEHNATHSLVVSHSQDAKKNPLSAEQKVKHAKHAFPGTNVTAASKEAPTILHHAAAAHAAGATHLHVIAGSDRAEEMKSLLHKYNGKDSAHGHYNFKSIDVHSSGQRDADSEHDEKKPETEEEKKKKQVQSISASKMRGFAAAGNKKEFHANAPSKMKPEHKDAMYNDVRKGMNLKEETIDQQADRAAQLKRFKDQMSQSNGPQIDTEIALDKKEKEKMTKRNGPQKDIELGLDKKEKEAMTAVQEHLTAAAGAGAWINDFISSTNPRFNNKSKSERRKMAIGAYMAAKAKGVQEGTLQGNVAGGDAMNTTTSAPSDKMPAGSVKKVKGFKFFNGTNEPNTQMTVKEESLDERNKANALMRKTMDASRGARYKLINPVPAAEPEHKTAQAHNKAIGRALRNEAMTGNPGNGYHGACDSPDEKYEATHKHVKNLTDADDKTVKHYLDSAHGRHLAGREEDHEYIKKDFKKFKKYYRPEMHESTEMARLDLQTIINNVNRVKPMVDKETDLPDWIESKITMAADYIKCVSDYIEAAEQIGTGLEEETAPVGKVQKIEKKTAVIKLHPNGVGSDTEEGWAKPKIKEGTMKSYKDFLQGLDEASKKKPAWLLAAELNAEKKEGKLKEEAEELEEKNWIAGAIKHPGAMTAAAKRAGETNAEYEQEHKHDSGKAGRRARLALTLKKMHEEQIDEIKLADLPSRKIQGKSYGADYTDPEGADDAWDKDKVKKPAGGKRGRPAGKGAGVYKARSTISQLKAKSAIYK